MITRREPLLWLQLMALAVIPLELELLRLILSGSTFGPSPALERLLVWSLSVVAPGVLAGATAGGLGITAAGAPASLNPTG